MGQAVKLADLAGQAYGMRQRPGGTFVVALPQADKVVEVDGSNVMDLWTDLQTPNGLWVDEMDRIWVTEFGGNGVSLRLPNGDTSNVIPAQDAPSANGVLFDPVRSMLFFTNYSGGELRRAPIDAMGNAGTVEIVDSVNGALDGLALDACGNVYAVDQQAAEIVRFLLQPDGSSAAVPEVLASAPTNIANAVFGRGPGFDPESLYAAGNPGDVYRIPTGVPGR
jgi:sugar lactone lactonase YvrE